jgi:hypothetical protein
MLKHIRCHGDTGKVKKSDIVIDRLLGKRMSLKLWVRALGSKTRGMDSGVAIFSEIFWISNLIHKKKQGKFLISAIKLLY